MTYPEGSRNCVGEGNVHSPRINKSDAAAVQHITFLPCIPRPRESVRLGRTTGRFAQRGERSSEF